MKITFPADAHNAVDVPDARLENVEPGATVDVAEAVARDTVASLLVQGWQAADPDAEQVVAELQALENGADIAEAVARDTVASLLVQLENGADIAEAVRKPARRRAQKIDQEATNTEDDE